MALREIESTLPPGFRFYPSDEELVCHYLQKKVANERIAQGTLVEVDLHAREPWELPEVAKLTATEWYFFSFRDRKYATGSRTNRATRTGYWKATGKDREVRSSSSSSATAAVVGMRKTLVFYRGRAPNGVKSGWVMHEFRLDTPHSPPREDWVLCRVFQKTKAADGDGGAQGGGDPSSPPAAFTGPSPPRAVPEPPDHSAAPAGGGYYYGLAFGPRQVEVAQQQCYGGGGTVADHHHHHHGFTRDSGGAAGFGATWGGGVAGGECGVGYLDMDGAFDVMMAGCFGGDMDEFPQVWR